MIFVDEENTEEVRIVKELEQGCNSIDIFLGQESGPEIGPKSYLEFCDMSKLAMP